MTFYLPSGLSTEAARELERACIAGGPDNMPWPSKVQIESGHLTVRRDVDESGYLVVPWETQQAGRLMGATATLMERSHPYQLQVELARGKVNQVRSQAADWQAGGLNVPRKLEEEIRTVSLTLGHALIEPALDQAARQAQTVLGESYQAAEELARVYMGQVFQVRHQREQRLQTVLGCRVYAPLDQKIGNIVAESCNSICIPFVWSSIESTEGSYDWKHLDALLDWAEKAGLTITAGPLVDFSSVQMPDWLWLWERDLTSLAKFMCAYVTAALKRYRRRIRRWHLTSASNSAAILSLGEEELLWLTVKLVQAAKQVDPGLEIIVGVTQPWGEYMALEDRTHSPFIFADTLIRSELNLAALDLEVVMCAAPRGSYCRDLLETSRMLDLYALLGVPLRVTLGYPSVNAADPKCDPELRVAAGHWHEGFSLNSQADWAESFGGLTVCKPFVQAVHWTHLTDADVHQFPNCGLIDAKGQLKPAFQRLHQLRERHLQ